MPWLDPVSPAEFLWYHGLIARIFADGAISKLDSAAGLAAVTGPEEFFVIPDELAALLPSPVDRPAIETPGEPIDLPMGEEFARASSALVDDSATFLAALRRGDARDLEQLAHHLPSFLLTHSASRFSESLCEVPRSPRGKGTEWREEIGFHRADHAPSCEVLTMLLAILREMRCLQPPGLELDPAVARPFLEKSRGEQLAALFRAWRDSAMWNDLHHVPGLEVEGNWRNEPALARGRVLAFLKEVPQETWWSVESFVAAIKKRWPDFQRPGGDYDSWYLRDKSSGEYLRGFEHWDRVDGALIRYLITGPLHWLGVVDVYPSELRIPNHESHIRQHERRITNAAFRVTLWGQALLAREIPQIPEPAGQLRVYADGRVTVDRGVSRYERFQAARFTEWVSAEESYVYRLTPKSMAQAESQGVHVRHILPFLNRSASNQIPPSLIEALNRWEEHGTEATAAELLVLKLKSAELFKRLHESPKASRYLGEALGPAAVEVKRQDWEKLRGAMAEMGILVD